MKATKRNTKTDLFGGRKGSTSNRINEFLIKGGVGSSALIARKTKLAVPLVSAQLSYLRQKGVVARKPRKEGRGFVWKAKKTVIQAAAE